MIAVTKEVAISASGNPFARKLYHRPCHKKRGGGRILWISNLALKQFYQFEYCLSCQTHIDEETIKKAKFIIGAM